MLIPVSQFLPPTPHSSLCSYICSLWLCLYFCFCKWDHQYYFSRFHICVNIKYVFFPFWLRSAWQSPCPSTSLQMTQFCPLYGWIMFCCLYELHFLYSILWWWTFRIFHVLDIINSFAISIGVHVSFWIMVFLSVYAQKCFLLITDVIICSLFPVIHITGLAGAGMSPATGSSNGHSPASAWKELCLILETAGAKWEECSEGNLCFPLA